MTDERIDEHGRVWILDETLPPGVYVIGLGSETGPWRTMECRAETPGEAILLAEAQARDLTNPDLSSDPADEVYTVRSVRHGPVVVETIP